MAAYHSLSVGDSVRRPGDWNGLAEDITGKIVTMGAAGGCGIELDEPIRDPLRGETLKRVFTMCHLLERI